MPPPTSENYTARSTYLKTCSDAAKENRFFPGESASNAMNLVSITGY